MDVSNKFIKFQQIKYNLFKSQNPETGLFDVIFQVEGKLLYAHKNMLNLVSETFASMLSDRWAPNKEEPIKIQGYGYDDFYQFITFLYTARCELSDTNIYAMVDIAEFYGIELFKEYCDEYLAAMEITLKNIFKLMELAEKYSMAQLKASTYDFLRNNFQPFADSDQFMKVSKLRFEELVLSVKDKVKPEDVFQAVYKWCEKQAMEKQVADPNLNLNDIIKTDMSDILPHIDFKKMELEFLLEFVVSRGFIFPSYTELSKILCRRILRRKVKVTDPNGRILSGNLISDRTVIDNIKFLKLSTVDNSKACWWEPTFNIPSTPSPLKKSDDIEWYLVYFYSGRIGIIHRRHLSGTEYLLAELTVVTPNFQAIKGCKIEIE